MIKVNTLCLVDDDHIFQFLTKRAIEQTKMVDAIQVFANGLQAINFLKARLESNENLPDMILLDLNMPVMDGWEFVEEYVSLLPRLGKKILLYIVSSSVSDSDLERAKSISSITDYVTKPVTGDKFMELLLKEG